MSNIRYRKNRLLILLSISWLLGCQSNDDEFISLLRNERFVTLERPDVIQTLEKVLGIEVKGNYIKMPAGVLDITIGSQLDSAGYRQYAFEFITPTNVLENLIIVKTRLGIHSYVLQYKPDSAYLEFTDGIWDVVNFNGYVSQLSLEREIISTNYMVNGMTPVNIEPGIVSENPAHRMQNGDVIKCCWETVKSTTTNYPMVLIHCDGGIEYTIIGVDWGRGRCEEGGTLNKQPSDSFSESGFNPLPVTEEGGGGTGTGTTGPVAPKDNNAIISIIDKLAIENKVREKLKNDPFSLIQIDCAELKKWVSISSFKPPQKVVDKIKRLDGKYGDFDILNLENASGVVVNMDYFAVTVTKFPKNLSPEKLFQEFRLNINSFIDTSLGEFSTEKEVSSDETALWKSLDPLGTIFHIEIPGQEGSVICSDYQSKSWKFTTISTPDDEDHPVSGTREFGYVDNGNSSYTFYVRGVDRYTSRIEELGADLALDDRFAAADALWLSFQNKFMDYLRKQKFGEYKKEPKKIYRPDWSAIRDVLTGKKSLKSIGCEK